MSFYTFAAANLTTADDRKRSPTVNKGQVARVIAFCLTLAVVLIVMAHRQSHAAESGCHGLVGQFRPQSHYRDVSRETFDSAIAGVTRRGTLA